MYKDEVGIHLDFQINIYKLVENQFIMKWKFGSYFTPSRVSAVG